MYYRTVFISDVHLGTKNAQADKLLKFLKENEFGKIYLVGDIIDMIAMKKQLYWKKKHNDVVGQLIKLSKKIEVIYIYGNHDIFLQGFEGEKFGNIKIMESDIHITENGDKYMVIHGHQFDGALLTYTWLYFLGNVAYEFSVWLNRILNNIRTKLKMGRWSLSLYLKTKVKDVIKFMNNFEVIVSEYGKKHNVDGIIAGHIHMYEDKMMDDIRYLNCGCWTEFTSFIAEDKQGRLKVIEL